MAEDFLSNSPDVQAQLPPVPIALSSVGVTGVEKVMRLRTGGQEQLFSITFSCLVDLGGAQKGAHMSRFEDVVNTAIGEAIFAGSAFRAELLAERIAELVRQRQNANRAEVHLKARYPEYKPAPVSGIQTQEIYTLHGIASATEAGTRRVVGVSAQGMTACPCAQELIANSARERLETDGFSPEQIDQIFTAVPVATHNQRGIGTLMVGLDGHDDIDLDALELLNIVEQSMSSEIYELMKRSDEQSVVERAHRQPRFVEDCVREAIAGVINTLPQLPDETFISAKQENLETIHQHNVVAQRHGLLGQLRAEIESEEPVFSSHLSLRNWLDAR